MENKIKKKAWLNRPVFENISIEAETKYPLETGGVLMGYFSKLDNIPVIMYASGPGPNAIHLKNSYSPDQEFDESIIAMIYKESGGLLTYIGDWHTHVAPIKCLSLQDKKTLANIATYKKARMSMPLMLILSFHYYKWKASIWQCNITKKNWWRKRVSIKGLKICYFELF